MNARAINALVEQLDLLAADADYWRRVAGGSPEAKYHAGSRNAYAFASARVRELLLERQ